jgi:cytochrome c oxidase subunit 2
MWGFAIVAIAVAVRGWLPPLASEHGAGIDRMLNYTLVTTGAFFVVGHIVLGYFLWRFGGRDRVSHRLASAKNERRWALVVVIAMALVAEGGVMILGLPVWGKLYAAAPPPEAITVEITGEQFAWNVRYPGKDGKFGRTDPKLIIDENPLGIDKSDPSSADDIFVRRVVVPVNRPVRIRLRSKDTLHSFFLPNLRIKQDAVPGMTMDFWFLPTRQGDFEIACSQLCGFGHFGMRGIFQVVTQQEFDKWLGEQSIFAQSGR